MRAGLAFALLPVLLTGCLYHMEHRVPMDATFGRVRDEASTRRFFRVSGTKGYLLGGTIPWSASYDADGHLIAPAEGRRIERLRIETRFSWLDGLLRLVPYLSYVWVSRTVEVSGVYVDPHTDPVAPGADAGLPDVASPISTP